MASSPSSTPHPSSPTAAPDSLRVRIRDVGELVVAIPFLLHFHPTRSLVVVGLRDGLVELTMRVDIPPVPVPPQGFAPWVAAIARNDLDVLEIFGFEDDADEAADAIAALVAACADAGLRVGGVVLVRGGQWSPAGLDGTAAAGERWRPVVEPSRVGAVAELVALERCPAPSREALVASVEEQHPDSAAVARLIGAAAAAAPAPDGGPRLTAVVRATRRMLRPAWAGAVADAGAISPADIALVVGALDDRDFRDALIGRLVPHAWADVELPLDVVRALRRVPEPGPRDLARWEAALLGVAQRLPDACPRESGDAIATLAAIFWGWGTGVVAAALAERALRLQPQSVLGRLVDQALANGVPPRRVDPAGRRRAG